MSARRDPTAARRSGVFSHRRSETFTVEQSDARDRSSEVLEDGTLGGYLEIHERPPAFEGSDGHPYTVSIEVEKVGDLRAPFGSYLVFPRWGISGTEIVGHLQSPLLRKARTRAEAAEGARELSLVEVKQLLESAIDRRREEGVEW